ncbi:MAG TPA: hypothetical protein G4O00_12055 [Thermoflexia bacterium]|nr:hypothetical protein [Thermoflexia bacterium]
MNPRGEAGGLSDVFTVTYEWETANRVLMERVEAAHEEGGGTCGSPRICQEWLGSWSSYG